MIFGVLLLLTAAFLRPGARRARVVATVVAALAALLGLAILVLPHRPDANAFFRRSRSAAVAG